VIEPVLEPEIPIIDPHHHLSHAADGTGYGLQDILEDAEGNNLRQSVFIQANSMYRADGPEAFRVVGEIEWVNGIAAESASGMYGETRIAAGIVGGGNLMLGDDVAPVLEAQVAASRRFRGIRHSVGYTNPPVRPQSTRPGMLADPTYRKGFSHLHRNGLSFEAWLYYNQLHDLVDLARAFPETTIILNHLGGPLGVGAWEGRIEEVFQAWKPAIAEVSSWLGQAPEATNLGRVAGEKPPLARSHDRGVRPQPLHVREQFLTGQGFILVHGALESLQEADEVVYEVGARCDVPRHRDACVQA
jgi:predicted TIM-barrel fold metal-dependent hydrolase